MKSSASAPTADRSALLCLKAVETPMGERYCTLVDGHADIGCEYRSTLYAGERVEACQLCGGPLGHDITRADEYGRLICGLCWRDKANAEWDAVVQEERLEAERRRRIELRRSINLRRRSGD